MTSHTSWFAWGAFGAAGLGGVLYYKTFLLPKPQYSEPIPPQVTKPLDFDFSFTKAISENEREEQTILEEKLLVGIDLTPDMIQTPSPFEKQTNIHILTDSSKPDSINFERIKEKVSMQEENEAPMAFSGSSRKNRRERLRKYVREKRQQWEKIRENRWKGIIPPEAPEDLNKDSTPFDGYRIKRRPSRWTTSAMSFTNNGNKINKEEKNVIENKERPSG